MNPVDVNSIYHDGLINIGFRACVATNVAKKALKGLGLVAEKGSFIVCGRGPLIAMVKVDAGKEQEWIDKLVALPEIEWAERVPIRHLMSSVADALKKRLGVK